MVNYFPYAYPGPKDAKTPFQPTVTVLPSPWNAHARLVHIGIKGWDIAHDHRPPARLTFLIDVSGSMQPDDRLPLIKAALRQLGDGLRPEDSVSIVSYANDTRVVLDPTPGSETAKIMAAFDSLQAAGGTAGGAGIQTAYRLAEQMFDPKAVNRIVLATDGDFNVGETDPRRLTRLVADKRKAGIYLTILGVGIGNLNDSLMQGLAQAGNGQAAYIDTLQEARKVWIEELGSTMFPIADDVKIQVEFNPAAVAEYRLIGYETRLLNRSDFANDRVDAGEIGSGHTVTAIYEYIPAGGPGRNIAPLRYKADAPSTKAGSGEIAFLKIRSKAPGAKTSTMMQRPIGIADMVTTIGQAPQDVRFGVAVAGFAQLLRKDSNVGWSPAQAAELAEAARGDDPHGWRSEFVQLVRLADGLMK
jgi:Ca-activated chloride channel family protein